MKTQTTDFFGKESTLGIFFIFVLSTSSLFIYFFANIPHGAPYNYLKLGTYYFGFLGYISVILTILFHYIIKASKWFKEKKMRIVIAIAIILGLSYSIFGGLSEKSWLIFLRDLAMAGLVILGLPFLEKVYSKAKKK